MIERIVVLLALAALALLPGYNPLATMPDEAWRVTVLAIVMATLWMTVALPLSITALLPLIILPLYNVQPLKDAATAYADPIIFLFLGAMILGGALEHQKLHRYLVVIATRIFGYRPETLVASMMGVTFFISMWINNTSTMAIILPLAVALVKIFDDASGLQTAQANFAKATILGAAYAAILGGSATLVGTVPNAIFASMMEKNHGLTIGFFDWMAVVLPMALFLLAFGWFLLCRVFYRQDDALATTLTTHLHTGARLPHLSGQQWLTVIVFAATVALWLGQGALQTILPWLNDNTIAIMAAVAVFALRLAPEQMLRTLAWDVLLLFGGGLALAAAITDSGLGVWLAGTLGDQSGASLLLIIFLLAAGVVMLSELASNAAIVLAFLPIIGSVATAYGVSPVMLAVPLTLAASYAFMMPAGTPSNALAFSSGYLSMRDMLRAGLPMNVAAIILITVFSLWFAPHVVAGG
jgi:sodium-dependent dicarboxylate transporter 2/3/5